MAKIRNEDLLIAYVESHTRTSGRLPLLGAVARFLGVSEQEAQRLGSSAIDAGRLEIRPDGKVKARFR